MKVLILAAIFGMSIFGTTPVTTPSTTTKTTDTTSVTNEMYPCPCHPSGDLGPCTHPLHAYGDMYPDGSVRPCVHPLHPAGDIYPCSHVCACY
jgi:hypothetical protein